MSSIKTIIGLAAIALTFVGYIPYIKNIIKRKTQPHTFSWFIWAIVTGIIYALQVKAGAGLGSFVTLGVSIISFFIFCLGLKQGDKNIKKIDVVFLILALVALVLWLVAKQPILSIILLTTIDMLGFVPTIRKSWSQPHSETLSLYVISTFRHGLSIVALAQYNIVTLLFPASWVIANALFALMLIFRRKN